MDKSPVEQAAEIILNAKREAVAVLSNSELYGNLTVNVNFTMERLVNQLNFISGGQATAPKNTEKVMFGPIEEMFGQKISTPKKVDAETLTPKEEERQKLIDKVNTLQANIDTLDNAKILEDYVTKEDLQAIRGLAKRAGMEDFRNATLDSAYLDLIRAGLKANADRLAAKTTTDANLAKASKSKSVDPNEGVE